MFCKSFKIQKLRRFLGLSTQYNINNFSEFAFVPTSQKTFPSYNVKTILSMDPSDAPIIVKGWVKSPRKYKKGMTFIDIDDGTTVKPLQVVLSEELSKRYFTQLKSGCCVQCTGLLQPSPGPKQPIELQCGTIEIFGLCDNANFPFPHDKKERYSEYRMEYMRKYLHFRPRLRLFSALFRLRSELLNAIHIFMKQHEFVNVTCPVITGNDCEGGGKVFTVASPFCTDESLYFDKESYLTVSGQMHLEAMTCALSRVYSITPTFRAEKSYSQRHLSEFLMFELEEAFVDSLDTLLDRAESICKFLIYYVSQNCPDELKLLHSETNCDYFEKLFTSKYIRMTYSEVVDLLIGEQNSSIKYGEDFNTEQERLLLRCTGNIPVFVCEFPASIKPFYMKVQDDKALCFDLIAPIAGEICGGSLREDNYEILKQRISSFQKPEALDWYLSLREFGSVFHGGFGFGFERLVQTLTGINSIRDVIPFPRYPHHCLT